MIVILNPAAGGGSALAKWRRIESCVRQRVGPFRLVVAEGPADVKAAVAAALRNGENEFIAAGGDGMVNLVLTAILEGAPSGTLARVKLGAVGLGSSNDFHKPLSRERMIDGIPLRLDFVATVAHDVGLLTYRDEADNLQSRRWIINASVGTTAEANHFFNQPNRTLRALKRLLPAWGMAYAALRTILTYRSRRMTLTLDEAETVRARVKNLGVVKNPHFTGSLCYGSPYEPGSGHFYVHLLRNVSFPRLALTLFGLLRGRFHGNGGAQSWRATKLRVEADAPFAVEGDGEVVVTSRAYFSVVPGLIRVCT